ncbi:MAG TPA: histidinol-phosphate transaminase [Xanthomonadaceae bacterium]|jgi:histidinol-phosphate aminotransferase|nr:histidinol-phosphate transaminase [Xanthomonadaceae bacterium]
MSALDLARPDLLAMAGYSSARMEAAGGRILLNANELPWPQDDAAPLNRYPDPQPPRLLRLMADLYGVDASQLLVGRGSNEMIDLLVRGFCRSGQDAILVQPPTFGIYAVCAAVHGASVVSAPLRGEGFMPDFDGVRAAVVASAETAPIKVVFACTPNNPTGGQPARSDLLRLARALRDRALLVVDEAYIEFAEARGLAGDVASNPNLVVLRTLSKAHGLAAARVGCMIAAPEIVALLLRVMLPYPVPKPCSDAAETALAPDALQRTQLRVAMVRNERERLRRLLYADRQVRAVLASQTNFLTVRFDDAGARYTELLAAGIVVRDVRRYPGLGDALRISIGTPEENMAVLTTLASNRERVS